MSNLDPTAPSGAPNAGGNSSPPAPDGGPSSDQRGPDAAPLPPPTVLTTETLDVAGRTRSFVLATPRTYSTAKTYPLVLVLHGDGGDGASMRAGFTFDNVSAEAAFVAYPSGTQGWNLYDAADDNPDLAFVVGLVDSLRTRFSIDPSRVFGTGFSSGAFMVNQVACRRPSLFRGIAPQSGGAPSEPRDPTASRWPNDYTRCANQTLGGGPAVLVVHGKTDGTVAFDSGDFTADYWAYVNGCAMTRTATTPSPCVQHDACPAGKPVEFCAIDNLDHALWVGAAAATWQFFQGL